MRHFTIFPISAAAVVTVAFALGCDRSDVPTAPGASAEPVDGRSPAARLVPFKGTFTATGAAADIPGDRCPALTVQIQGPGTATHLGSLTTVQSHCMAPPSFDFTDGLFTLTAANGDQLVGTYEGEFRPLDPPLAGIDGEFMFTGGTGRFIGATGGGEASGVQNFATGDATVVLEGRISSVGASKR
jgi:hypothetical protein